MAVLAPVCIVSVWPVAIVKGPPQIALLPEYIVTFVERVLECTLKISP